MGEERHWSQGVYSGFQVTGMIEWGKNQNPKKSHAKFLSLKNFQKGLTHKSQVKDIKNSLQQKGIPE